jgi:hypothetical protein
MDPWYVLGKNGDAAGRDLERGRDRGNETGAPLPFGNHEFPDALVAWRGCAEKPCTTPKPTPDGGRRPKLDGAAHARNQAGINRGRELHS